MFPATKTNQNQLAGITIMQNVLACITETFGNILQLYILRLAIKRFIAKSTP